VPWEAAGITERNRHEHDGEPVSTPAPRAGSHFVEVKIVEHDEPRQDKLHNDWSTDGVFSCCDWGFLGWQWLLGRNGSEMKHMLEKLLGSSVDLAGLAHQEFGIDD
jgi:hypothetical protein